MRHIRIIYTFFISTISVFSLVGCSSDQAKIIGKSDMSKIIADFYLADQILEEGTEKRMQADTMLVYMPIIEKHGYTLADYKNSVRYYLQKDDSYKKIHIKAKNILSSRSKALKKEVDAMRKRDDSNTLIYWQARTDVLNTPVNELIMYPYLRGFKWLAMAHTPIKWNVLDTTVTDSPKNIVWWLNNLSPKPLSFGERIEYENRKEVLENKKENVVNTLPKPQPLSARRKQKPKFIEPDENTAKEMREKELKAQKLETEIIENK